METVCEKNRCAGCMACIDICSQKAIKINDTMDAYNAVIDSSKCVGCNSCHQVCQENNPPIGVTPIYWKQGWSEDIATRSRSSSGGFATAIEQAFIKNGGIVCSCCFKDGKFRFSFAEHVSEVWKFTGSKYVKSDPSGIYKRVESYLKQNKRVLFVGLPCQVAALKNYIKQKDNLYTVDLICHGSPSPQVLEYFLKEQGCSIGTIKKIDFRVKQNMELMANQRSFTVPTICDQYTFSFLNSISYTENCYYCKYAKIERSSDITLGDSWGTLMSKEEQHKGISLALCQTEKGLELLMNSHVHLEDVDLNLAIHSNS